ncbi:hypothetical protein D3C80_1647890 [compost metagenome]
MSRACSTIQYGFYISEIVRLKADNTFRIHFRDRRQEKYITTGIGEHGNILLYRNRIVFKIFGIIKLSGVNKYAANSSISILFSVFDQADMPFM